MSQYFSRLATRSGVADAAPTRQPRSSVTNDSAPWGEQSAEITVSSNTIAHSPATFASVEDTDSAGIATTNPRATATTNHVFENKNEVVVDIENGNATPTIISSITADTINSSAKPATLEKQYAGLASMPASSSMVDRTVAENPSSNTFEEHAYTSHASISSLREKPSLLAESLDVPKRSSLSPHSEPPTARKVNSISRAEKNSKVNASGPTMAHAENAIATASAKTTSRAIVANGNNGTERTRSRPLDITETSELVSSPASRQSAQIHIGKIELEIHAATAKAAPPTPAHVKPTPAAKTKRSAGFSPNRHYLRSR